MNSASVRGARHRSPAAHVHAIWSLAACAAVALNAAASPPLFTGLGVLPGGENSGAFAVTPNGTYVVGYSATVLGDRAFRWSRTTGMQSLGTLPGGRESRATGVSADGQTVVGYNSSFGGYRAFRWTGSAGMQDLGTLPGGSYSVASAVSDDGAIVVGYSDAPSGPSAYEFRAFRWTNAGGMENLGTMPGGSYSYGQAISADGSVIVGVGDADGSFDFRAFRRTDAGMANLGTVTDGFYSIAFGVSADGGTVVGYGRSPGGLTAWRWNGADGMVNLGKFPGSENTIARSASADGSVLVGSSESITGDIAFIWTSTLGLVDLNSYLRARGIDLNGWTLLSAYAISADGLTITGIGNHNGREEAWVVSLGTGQDLTPIEQLGKSIMSDSNLSSPAGQSCMSCHSASAGFTNPISSVNEHGAVHRGAVASRFGHRKPPTLAYAAQSPPLHLEDDTWVGGLFFDGHAPGWTLGDPLAEQAQFPFLNPVEQNNADAASVVSKIAGSGYATLFRDVWGANSLPDDGGDAGLAYERVVRSIAAYERSREVNPFNSKYDDYLAGRVALTPIELRGLTLFNGVAGCAACHPSQPGPSGEPPLFTDFTYDNIGIPRNPENPFYGMPPEFNPDGADFADPALGGFLEQAGFPRSVFGPAVGKHKVATLRNVDRRPDGSFVRAYGHNGFFKSLEEVVHFYNTRDVESWPPPEVPQNVNISELGNLHLTPDDEAAVVAFLKTLTDRDAPPITCAADFDRDGFLTGDDYDLFVDAFAAGDESADFDRNGFVTGVDFDLFVLAFETGC